MVKPLERLYTDRCDIYQWIKKKDELLRTTDCVKVLKYGDIPCRISFKSITSVNQQTFEPIVSQVVKLFISNDIEIKAGSEIIVHRNGKSCEYKSSGLPAIYSNHQEIILLSAEERA